MKGNQADNMKAGDQQANIVLTLSCECHLVFVCKSLSVPLLPTCFYIRSNTAAEPSLTYKTVLRVLYVTVMVVSICGEIH